jgi:hypothetical protein
MTQQWQAACRQRLYAGATLTTFCSACRSSSSDKAEDVTSREPGEGAFAGCCKGGTADGLSLPPVATRLFSRFRPTAGM